MRDLISHIRLFWVYHKNMDSKDLFKQALNQATWVVNTSQPSHFDNTTPCADWNCRALLNHMLYELAWVDDLIAGRTVSEVGKAYDGDLLKDDHHGNWHATAHKAMDAVKKADPNKVVHLSYADVPAERYIKEIAGDLLIHGWDLAQALQYSLLFEPQAAQALYVAIVPRKKEYAASGLFGAPLEVPQDARLQTKILAMVGRREPAI